MEFDVADDAILFVESAEDVDLDDADPLATRAGNTPDVAAVAVDRDDAAPVAFTGADPAAVAKDREIAIEDADARKDADADALLIDGDEADADTLAIASAVAVERDDADPEPVTPLGAPDACGFAKARSRPFPFHDVFFLNNVRSMGGVRC